MQSKVKVLLEFLFSGTTLRRWNGLIHPVELTEVDRQGHKMMIAWFLYILEKPNYSADEAYNVYQEIVEGAFFNYCLNLALTDIKPSIYQQIVRNQEHHKAIVHWAMESFLPLLHNIHPSLSQKASYYLTPPYQDTKAKEILKAASLYSRLWEYHLLRDSNAFLHINNTIFKELSLDIEVQCDRLPSLNKILPSLYTTSPEYTSSLRHIASLCGTLRFQRRWSQIARLPETSVLGHSFLVSVYSYIFSTLVHSCPVRTANTFFSALFHDLPELVTQDIVNPVKHSSSSVTKIIQEYEHQEMQNIILLPLQKEEPSIAQELLYLLGYNVGSEFYNTIILNDAIQRVSFQQLHSLYNYAQFSPKDGTLIKLCDNLSALIEAHTSIMQGVHPKALIEARERIINNTKEYTFCSFLNEQSADLFIQAIDPTLTPIIQSIQEDYT